MIAHITFSISYVTVVVRARLAAMNPEVEHAALDLGATRVQTLRLVTLPELWPAILAAGLLVFALSFDDFVISFFTTGESPQPLPVRIYSAIRFGVTPTINAIGTLMLAVSAVLIGLAIALPRLLGRRESGLGVLVGRETRVSAIRFEGVTKRFGDTVAVQRARPRDPAGRVLLAARAVRAAARPRRCAWSPASSSRARGASSSRASRSRPCRPTSAT